LKKIEPLQKEIEKQEANLEKNKKLKEEILIKYLI